MPPEPRYREDMPAIAYAVLSEGNGGSIAKVAAALDISKETLNVWRKKYPALSDAISRGLAVSESIWEDPNFHPGMMPLRYRLNMSNRFGWSDKSTTEVTGSNGGPVAVEHSFADVDRDQAAAIAREYLVNIQSSDDGAEG